jgi:phage N-6-adenine-methyltransferase
VKSMNIAVLMSSKSDRWSTPREFLSGLRKTFGDFELDPAATPSTTVAANFYTRKTDGLASEWFGRVFVNPPYGRPIRLWSAKVIAELDRGQVKSIVFLCPARTDATWWRNLFARATTVYFVRGRLSFGGIRRSGTATFPSSVFYLRPGRPDRKRVGYIGRDGLPCQP